VDLPEWGVVRGQGYFFRQSHSRDSLSANCRAQLFSDGCRHGTVYRARSGSPRSSRRSDCETVCGDYKRGFDLVRITTQAGDLGCNEFVFIKH
jgi:hypothetical protein